MPKTKNNIKKTIVAIIALVCSLTVITTFTLSSYNATAESNSIASAGTVDISVDDIALTNSSLLSPGDNDPSLPRSANDGVSHKFSYSINNLSTKAIKTRQTIIITVNQKGNTKKFLDPTYIKLLQDKDEIESCTYILKSGKEVEKVKSNHNVIAVKYTFIGDCFEGSDNAYIIRSDKTQKYVVEGIDDENSVVVADANGDVAQQYEYDLAILKSAPNSYQNAEVNIYVAAEAIQYKNSEEDDWDTAATVVRGFSTNKNLVINSLPSFIENAEGEEIDYNISVSEHFEELE